MNDFELMYTFSEAFNGMVMLLTTYFSIVFAFVVASYMAAKELSRALVTISITLFTMASALFILFTVIVVSDMTALMEEIRKQVAMGSSSLEWVGFADPTVRILPPVAIGLLMSLMTASYVGALLFFFYRRRTGDFTR